MREIDFYPEICRKLVQYFNSYLSDEYEIYYSYDKLLPQMVNEIETKFGRKYLSLQHVPKLKLDILLGVKNIESNNISYILVEVKYKEKLGLSEYSQLVGYLQVAQNIKFGLLFLVSKGGSISSLSDEFTEIIRNGNLPMRWEMIVNRDLQHIKYFQTGICYYIPNNGIEWINVEDINGISSFEKLVKEVIFNLSS